MAGGGYYGGLFKRAWNEAVANVFGGKARAVVQLLVLLGTGLAIAVWGDQLPGSQLAQFGVLVGGVFLWALVTVALLPPKMDAERQEEIRRLTAELDAITGAPDRSIFQGARKVGEIEDIGSGPGGNMAVFDAVVLFDNFDPQRAFEFDGRRWRIEQAQGGQSDAGNGRTRCLTVICFPAL